jgi:lipid-binding SYLF domain-containing protein
MHRWNRDREQTLALAPLLSAASEPAKRLNEAADVFTEVMSAPGTVRIEGGRFGFQIGGSETDLMMLVMNDSGEGRLLSSKFTLGAEGSVAAGPVGRTATAQTDAQLHAEILSWSRSQGLFAGVALEGATLRQDLDDNAKLYGGQKLENREIVTQHMRAPRSAAKLLALLNKYSRHEHVETTSTR